MLALILPLTFAAIAQGFAYTKIGITPLFWAVGGTLGTIGCGLLYTMDESTSTGKWIGYQILVGVAVGLTTQVALQNAQVQCRPEDLSQATAVINCECVQVTVEHLGLIVEQSSSHSVDRSSYQQLNVASTMS